jgi:hypothetical protein
VFQEDSKKSRSLDKIFLQNFGVREHSRTLGQAISFWNTKGDDKDGRFIVHNCNVPYKDQKVFLRTKKVKSESGGNLEIEKSEENIFAKFWNLRIVKNALFSGA